MVTFSLQAQGNRIGLTSLGVAGKVVRATINRRILLAKYILDLRQTCHKPSRFGIWLDLTFVTRTDFGAQPSPGNATLASVLLPGSRETMGPEVSATR